MASFEDIFKFKKKERVTCSQEFYVLKKKIPSTSVRFEPANLGSRGEHVTPRPPRPLEYIRTSFMYSYIDEYIHTSYMNT